MTTAIAPTSHSVRANGLNLHYLEWGRPDATPLVLLHGLGSSAGEWQRVAAHFADRYRVIAFDQRGHGESERADEYSTGSMEADLAAAVDALELDRFVLCGASMGGATTLAYTARHPERVRCALVNDAPPALEPDFIDLLRSAPDTLPEWRSRADAIEAWRARSGPLTPKWAHDQRADAVLKVVDGGVTLRHDPALGVRFEFEDLWDEARTITRPILFIRGGRSSVLSAETLMRMDLEIAPARSVTLEKAGHATFLDMEPEWLAAAEAFFAAHDR
ncbi:MAG: alpha/beta hydrolase [Chloroflexi bacterium]|nr:alpha/beta hydrolase [Chloroflexota bacterium]MDA1002100.1 alpha/beta hydrolase [Chloroflexota bacterium]